MPVLFNLEIWALKVKRTRTRVPILISAHRVAGNPEASSGWLVAEFQQADALYQGSTQDALEPMETDSNAEGATDSESCDSDAAPVWHANRGS